MFGNCFFCNGGVVKMDKFLLCLSLVLLLGVFAFFLDWEAVTDGEVENPFDSFIYSIKGVYVFEDDSICPCASNNTITKVECNEEINRLLGSGYSEVRFC